MKLRLLVSLITEDNDFQREQAVMAQETARKLGLEINILYADGDSII